MNLTKIKIVNFFALVLALFLFTEKNQAQSYMFNYHSRIELPPGAAEPPEIISFPDVNYPDDARKNGIEGILKSKMTLDENGKVRDIVILEGLPNGVNESFINSIQKLYFQPAKKNGKPVSATLYVDLIIVAAYNEGDKNIIKPVITENPAAAYPEKYRAQKIKGKVYVGVIFYSDKTLKIINVNSVMPKEFDESAQEAAAKVKFEPAVHKKSKKSVSQAMTVIYEFKP